MIENMSKYIAIEDMCEVMHIFNERFLEKYYVPDMRIVKIEAEKRKVTFYFQDAYSITAWIDVCDGALQMENSKGESIYDYAAEFKWTEDDINYLKYGVEKLAFQKKKKVIRRFNFYRNNYVFCKKIHFFQ